MRGTFHSLHTKNSSPADKRTLRTSPSFSHSRKHSTALMSTEAERRERCARHGLLKEESWRKGHRSGLAIAVHLFLHSDAFLSRGRSRCGVSFSSGHLAHLWGSKRTSSRHSSTAEGQLRANCISVRSRRCELRAIRRADMRDKQSLLSMTANPNQMLQTWWTKGRQMREEAEWEGKKDAQTWRTRPK